LHNWRASNKSEQHQETDNKVYVVSSSHRPISYKVVVWRMTRQVKWLK